jgi:hypothetical protein
MENKFEFLKKSGTFLGAPKLKNLFSKRDYRGSKHCYLPSYYLDFLPATKAWISAFRGAKNRMHLSQPDQFFGLLLKTSF